MRFCGTQVFLLFLEVLCKSYSVHAGIAFSVQTVMTFLTESDSPNPQIGSPDSVGNYFVAKINASISCFSPLSHKYLQDQPVCSSALKAGIEMDRAQGSPPSHDIRNKAGK